jgi:hypothetical protein
MSDPFEKWPRWLLWLIDRTSGGCVYQNQSMSEHGIPPVPAWTVSWFFDLKRWWRPTPRQEKSDDEEIPFEETKLPNEHPPKKGRTNGLRVLFLADDPVGGVPRRPPYQRRAE